MRDANITEKLVKFDVLSSPIGLDMNNFAIKETLDMTLKL
jgi:hypothetical protein